MTDQATEGLLSPYLRKRRLMAVKPFLKGKIFDFGCGSGALAKLVHPDFYWGVDKDNSSLQKAQNDFPSHRFVSNYDQITEKFDTIVSLAVIEHVSFPIKFLKDLSQFLEDTPLSRLILTTPHPSVEWIHHIGAKIGFFSKHANEEHEELLDKKKLVLIGKEANLKLLSYSRFLLGANQIAIYARV